VPIDDLSGHQDEQQDRDELDQADEAEIDRVVGE
jgi:hypothetical protein